MERTISKGYNGLKDIMEEIKYELDLTASQVWLMRMCTVPKSQKVDLLGRNNFHAIRKSEK